MRTCLTLNDRPQECYNSELNTPWLFTLVAIFSGCICLTVTIVLMVISHWDRTVGPYAKWIGFSAGKNDKYLILMNIGINLIAIFHFYLKDILFESFFSNIVLPGLNSVSHRVFCGRDWWCSLSTPK